MVIELNDLIYSLSSKWRGFTYLYRKPYYRYRLFKRFCRTPYYGSWEMVEQIFHYPFECLLEFYENCGEDIYEGEGQVPDVLSAKEEMKWLCNWYKVTRLERQEEIDYLLHLWHENFVSWVSPFENGFSSWNCQRTKYSEYLSKLHSDEEQKFELEKQDALIRLIKIRDFMWT